MTRPEVPDERPSIEDVAVRERACRRVTHLWVFDFDGTVSGLQADGSRAGFHPACRSLLEDLLARRADRCAILSSRRLADLVSVVDVPGLFLGGGSGVEWRLPNGEHRLTADHRESELLETRRRILPEILGWARQAGVRIEDKRWSLAVHLRDAEASARGAAARWIGRWRRGSGLPVFRGPRVFEIQLLPGVDKSFGLRRLAGLVPFDSRFGRVFYAGDDENDALAMELALTWGGKAVVVGPRKPRPGVEAVTGPAELAGTVRQLLESGW
jgi:trehalose 6-phosphate phosphatase